MNHAAARLRNAEIARRYEAGQSAASLATEYGVTVSYVYNITRNLGVGRGRLHVAEKTLRRRAAMRELHSLGMSGGASCRLLKFTNKSYFSAEAKRIGLKFPYDASRWEAKGRNSQQRAAKMAAMYRSGMTLQQIGEQYGITRERVRQLMTKHEGMRHDGGGQHVKAVAKRQRSTAALDARYQAKYGCTFAQYAEVRELGRQMRANGAGVYRTPLRAYFNQKNNARARSVGWNLTFWQWWTIWQESGKWDQRGRGRDLYVMSRFGDCGAYEPGNIYIGTLSENSAVQPNNPYRKSHPDHGKIIYTRSKVARGCSVEGCGKSHYAFSYCNNHYYHFVLKPRASAPLSMQEGA